MVISFDKNKGCTAYKGLMENPTDRQAVKSFNKIYNQSILKASIKVYQKLKNCDNAYAYNQTTSGDNKIEKVTNIKDKNPVVLKVRIQDSYRKFFHFYETNTLGEEDLCLTKNWVGQYNTVNNILVFEINKHDYLAI